jgi:hypothetical protein
MSNVRHQPHEGWSHAKSDAPSSSRAVRPLAASAPAERFHHEVGEWRCIEETVERGQRNSINGGALRKAYFNEPSERVAV